MMKWGRVVLTLALVCYAAAQTTYYVNNVGGVNQNTCTTINDPCPGINAALSLAQDGDTIVLLDGDYLGADNVPFEITQAGLTLTAQNQNQAIIRCEQIFPYCGSIQVFGQVQIVGITFVDYKPLTQQQVFQQLQSPTQLPFQGLLTARSRFAPPESWPPPQNSLTILNCEFTNNTVTDAQGRWSGASIIFANELFPSDSVVIVNSNFHDNNLSGVNAYYSNVDIVSTTFSNNNSTGLGAVLAATTHTWIGGVNVTIEDSVIDHNNQGAGNRFPVISLDGTPCLPHHTGNDNGCATYRISGTNFDQNGGGEGVIVLQNGAQVTLESCSFTDSLIPAVSTVGGAFDRINAPSKVHINDTNFMGDFAVLNGYFVDSNITNCNIQATTSTPIQVTGGLIVFGTTFYNADAPYALDISRGIFTIDSSNFYSYNNLFRFGAKSPIWQGGAAEFTTVIINQNYVSAGAIQVEEVSFLFLSGNDFDYISEVDSLFTCYNDGTLSSEVNLVGEENYFANTGPLGASSCWFVCNTDNNKNCEKGDVDYVIQTQTVDFKGWEIALLIFLGIFIIWAVVASGLIASFVYTMLRPLKEEHYSGIN